MNAAAIPKTLLVIFAIYIGHYILSRAGSSKLDVPVKIEAGSELVLLIGGAGGYDISTGRPFAAPITYRRPDKPEQVTVELWTSDGKYWHAKWVEVKP